MTKEEYEAHLYAHYREPNKKHPPLYTAAKKAPKRESRSAEKFDAFMKKAVGIVIVLALTIPFFWLCVFVYAETLGLGGPQSIEILGIALCAGIIFLVFGIMHIAHGMNIFLAILWSAFKAIIWPIVFAILSNLADQITGKND